MEYIQKLTSRWTEPLSDQVQKHKTGYEGYNINIIMALFCGCFQKLFLVHYQNCQRKR